MLTRASPSCSDRATRSESLAKAVAMQRTVSAGRHSREVRDVVRLEAAACERSGYCPHMHMYLLGNALAMPHLTDQRARKASARHDGRDPT